MKTFLVLATCLITAVLTAQVGYNTTAPEASLDIRAANHLGAVTATDGVLVSRVNDLTTNGTQDGQLVYLIASTSTHVNGFYYWDVTNGWTLFRNSKNYGTHTNLTSLNTATNNNPSPGSKATLTDATGLVNWDGAAINANNTFYSCTFKNYGGTFEWRVSYSY